MPELSALAADSRHSGPQSPFDAAPTTTSAATFGPGIASDGKKSNFVQTALAEARHFAGGLIPHPTESTKHYTILRHSPPLIFYRGPSTSVEITIFSSPDHPLPADRTLWLQQRGFSGDSGMKIKAFFNATDSWLHVTPSTQAEPNQLTADTERAWQRDIGKAAKKLLKEKGPKKAHVPRETHVIRVPESSDDGYFRLILCTGKGAPNDTTRSSSRCKTLCTSPIFRVASTSTDSSVFRGASLSTIPLEMGVYVASMVTAATVNRYTAPILQPVEGIVNAVRPGFVAETVSGLVCDEVSERVAERDTARDQAFFAAHQAHVTRFLEADPHAIHPIGPGTGPEAPFPLQFQGKVVAGTGRSQTELGVPTANLAEVPDEIRYRLRGNYFGWAQVLPPKQSRSGRSSTSNDSPWHSQQSSQWHQAIITIAPHSPYAPPSVNPKPYVTVHLLHFPPPTTAATPSPATADPLLGRTLAVMALGLLRPHSHSPSSPTTAAPGTMAQKVRLDAHGRDVCLTLASLGRDNWQPDAGAVRVGLERQRAERGLGDRAKERVSSPVQKIPGQMHRIGVRMRSVGEERDRVRGVGGYWVKRG
ncbi:hypothetical protein C7999DRAFT_12538 [Corynascus novoguineensis]|uniref:Riboflavin kinase n=1 Tax=Corynascus novoguineensis TaxID=1126955 RepID=A0AAN7CWK9_9PEZI|nr:hypothetical protein C7999DRAFT_12538 [Corynascus novoguineensis]